MNNKEFKAGDLCFELTPGGRILLSKLGLQLRTDGRVTTDIACYTAQGINEQLKVSRLLHATPKNHHALATLYGEDAVPALPLEGSDLTKKLLKTQKYVMCLVSDISDEDARSNDSPRVHVVTGLIMDYFDLTEGSVANFAVPVDVDGNEITEVV